MNDYPLLETEFLYNPEDKGQYCHAPTLLQTGSGDLLAVWYAYPNEEHVGASLVLARRPAHRTKWDPSTGILGPFGSSAGNPVLFQQPNGRIWLLFVLLKGTYWNDAVSESVYSDDEGRTWSAPTELGQKRGVMLRHPPLLLSSEFLLLPAYDEITGQSVLLSSQKPYTTWKTVYRFEDLPLIQPVLVREGPNRLILFFRPLKEPYRIWRSHSLDEGITWSAPVRTSLPNPLSGISAFVVNGNVALVYNHSEEHRRNPLSIAWSRDGGMAWGTPRHIDAIPGEVSYPSFLVGRDGRIHGVYTYNRRMIKYVSLSTEMPE